MLFDCDQLFEVDIDSIGRLTELGGRACRPLRREPRRGQAARPRCGGFIDESYEQAGISHLLERVGLFEAIVIGEAAYLSVTALAGEPAVGGGAAALACFLSGSLAAWATLALAALALVLLDLVSRLLGARAAAAAP